MITSIADLDLRLQKKSKKQLTAISSEEDWKK